VSVAPVDAVASPSVGAQSAIARIAELQALVSRATGAEPVAAPPAQSGGASFQQALASAGGFPTPFASALASAGAPGLGSDVTAAGTATGLGEPSPFDGLILAAAQRHGIDPAVLKGLIRAESNFDPSVTSPAGAGGLVQLMPGTAASLGVTDRFDPAQSIDGGARYLRQQLDAFGGDLTKALAAYNAGPGAVRRYGGVPPYAETQAYVQKVQAYADEYRSAPAAGAVAPVAAGSLPPTTGSGSIT
jgi:soluble lytic murein transglycosylase-like protein